MILIVGALAVLGFLIGAAAHLPPSVSLIAGAVIGCWLIAFAVRERRWGRWW
ncbi:hypothetical protein RM780_01140 [Streptomyces sp. DSM 44917]|uniref:Small hydrophobic protein n=1 Tax=Streptomyces boetiae TaxID=3075541 RepID=A0ABU2L1Z2_9ACTN|nr:hypothetical protein [Streptomyces sp. DSM 44917]MDT0305571.1 hypothetical protein [Streptomyces sp. DSM 44917]